VEGSPSVRFRHVTCNDARARIASTVVASGREGQWKTTWGACASVFGGSDVNTRTRDFSHCYTPGTVPAATRVP
jgi:hypothetical protein